MELAFAITADAAEVGPSGKFSLIGGDFENINVPQLPIIYTRLALVVKLFLQPAECERSHTLEIKVLDPEGIERSPGVLTEFTAQKVPGNEDAPVRYIFVLNFPALVLLSQGRHTLLLLVDNAEIGRVFLNVLLASPDGNNQSVHGNG